MGTVPPFGMGQTQAPFGAGEGEFDFNPEKPPGIRWISWSTLLFVLACAGGYWKYRQMQAAPPPPPAAQAKGAAKPTAAGGMATPFTALKQAQATIKDAGEKHKAAYDLVEKMLDDPNAPVDAAAKPAVTAQAMAPAASEGTPVKMPRDAAAVQIGSDDQIVVPAGSPRPSAGFIRWIKAAKFGGVRISERPRALIGASAFSVGDVVEGNLGIVLMGYNAETRSLRFQEPSGAVIERRI